MKFMVFQNVRSGQGMVCTQQLLFSLADSERVKEIVAECGTGNCRRKSELPAVTWQAWYVDGRRVGENARSSGLFMVDIDHVGADVRAVHEGLVAWWMTD